MLESTSVWGPPPVTSHLWLLILSCALHSQPALSDLVFSTRPEDGVGVLGAPLMLHCAVYDSSRQGALSVRWERASGEAAALSPGPDKGIYQVANGSLLFPQLREGDLGRYVCSAGIGAKQIRTVVQVMEAELEAVFFSPQSLTVSEGQAVFLQCVSGNSSPPAHVTWLKDNTLFTKGTQIQGQYGGGNQRKTSGTLHLSNVLIEDEGEYVCVTHNPLVNTSLESKAATLTVQGVPTRLQITQGPDNLTIAIETEVSMRCAARGFPAPTVQWFKDSHLLVNSSGLSLQNKGQLLVFKNVSEEDEGSYHCEARNERETVRSQPAYLLPAEMEWSFVQQPTNQTVRMGDSVTLVCRPPYSRPPAMVSWFKNNRLLIPKTHFTVGPNGDLIFHSVHDTDSGVYFCRASNVHLYRSVTSRTARLTILAPPSVRLWPPVVMVPVGAQVVFHCQVWGNPLPFIVWSKQGRSMQTGGKIAVGVRNATLYILSVRSYDEGTYTCEASNTVGRERSTATLRVAAEDDPADRDKQHRQIVSAVPNIEAEQTTPLSSDLSLVQRSEMIQLQAGSTVSVQASLRDSRNDITQVSTPDTLRLLSSLRQTALRLTGLNRGQTGLMVPPDLHSQLPLDQASAKPTQPTITQIQPPVLQPPPLYQPLDLLTQPSQNMSQPAKPAHQAKPTRPNDTEPTEWLKRNTSQSPMRTSQDPRVKLPSPWLPVLEKHDIPIVVGVGVSLAFIFITMAFYSLVQKNEPATAIRVPRNLGVPCRHAERLATRRTYENRAFEDDDLVAVIEQSPNTSDTRARPPAPSPITVTIDPASDETQETQPRPTPDHSVIAETYPEPNEDTQVDPFLDEEDCSLSHPSIQLQCVEDWGDGGVEYGQCQGQDILPEPPSLSPSPFRSPSPCLTTVAVDVHFYPAALASATTAMATVTATTQINATATAATPGPQLSSGLTHSQEHDQSAPSMCQSK
ncbi:hypothetical protein J4Q44_G00235120 [Coregonus suidteri]|uniref:Ig-like domain-containing protein n=1 Tax=Coregonus suidteri TaxID=861788 RepID=A0AAN8L738_9TELE